MKENFPQSSSSSSFQLMMIIIQSSTTHQWECFLVWFGLVFFLSFLFLAAGLWHNHSTIRRRRKIVFFISNFGFFHSIIIIINIGYRVWTILVAAITHHRDYIDNTVFIVDAFFHMFFWFGCDFEKKNFECMVQPFTKTKNKTKCINVGWLGGFSWWIN